MVPRSIPVPVSSDSTAVTGHGWLWAPSAPPLAAALARPRPLRCTEPPHSPGGQRALCARRWARGGGSSSELLQESGIATSWGAGSGTSPGRTGTKTRQRGRGWQGLSQSHS